MRFSEYRAPKKQPDTHDGVVDRTENNVGLIERPNKSQKIALVKFFSKEDLDTEIGADIKVFQDLRQLVFARRTPRKQISRFFRQEHHFSLMTYGENARVEGELHMRTIYPRFDGEAKKPEHRVERLILEGETIYQAPGI